MMAGAAAGVGVGVAAGARWEDPDLEVLVLAVRAPATIFLAVLKALAVPLVVTSVVLAVAKMGGLARMGRAMGATALYFLTTTLLAVVTGIVLVDLVRPGDHLVGAAEMPAVALAAEAPRSAAQAVYEVLVGLFPPNLFAAMAESNVLGLIVFALLFGGLLDAQGDRARPLVELLDVVNDVLMQLVRLVVWFAPLGIFGLVADRIGKAGGGMAVMGELGRLGWYSATVVAGLLVHAVVTLPLLLRVLGRRSPRTYAAGMAGALLTAFGTASSAATMAVTLRCVTERNGVSREAADLVIPLGTTVNMDGTALYEAVAVIFIAQASGLELSAGQHLVIALTATLAAIGAAAIPEAGLVTMILVLGAVGLPAEGVGLLLAVDWILDRLRTTVNVWGDSVGAAIIERVPKQVANPS